MRFTTAFLFSLIAVLAHASACSDSGKRSATTVADNLIRNGDFSGGFESWDKFHSSNVNDKWNLEIEGDDPYVSWSRRRSHNDGGSVGVVQTLDVDAANFKKLVLSLDVMVKDHNLKNSGWWSEKRGGSGEYPAKVILFYHDIEDRQHIWTHGFLSTNQSQPVDYTDPRTGKKERHDTKTTLTNHTIVPRGEWYHYEVNLVDESRLVEADLAQRGRQMPRPQRLTMIRVVGEGWDFASSVDNIQLYGESEEPVPITKPVSAPEEPEMAEPLVKSSPPEPPVEPQPEPLRKIRDVTSELNTLKTQLASLEGKLAAEEAFGYPDTVVLTTGREMECEILDETETSIRIKTSSGTASMSKNRIESFRHATESEKAQVAEAISKNNEIRKQIDDIAKQIAEIETVHKEPSDKRQVVRGKGLLDYAKDGHDGMVSQFLDDGMAPDARDHNRRTPLMLAAFEGHNEVVEALLKAGADLHARDVDGWEALTYAAYGGRAETVSLLIEEGADVDTKVNSGQSVLTIARQKGHQEVIDLLQRKGAKP